uniref:Uncharacterized protein n=1 Tax=Ditylenchus dipsaci TaxID=166011 RepID=A0A915DLL7_9BILA
MEKPEENEKKPFYKSTLFIVIAPSFSGSSSWFKESDDNGAPSTDALNALSRPKFCFPEYLLQLSLLHCISY